MQPKNLNYSTLFIRLSLKTDLNLIDVEPKDIINSILLEDILKLFDCIIFYNSNKVLWSVFSFLEI